MIGHLRGQLLERGGGVVIIDCGGVGYEVHVSGVTMMALPPVGDDVAVRVYTHAQENKIALFGFATLEERQLFDLLITVKRVGPTAAVKILSAGPATLELAQMIAAEQDVALKALKGVGKKTAELLVVELRDKCEALLATWGASGKVTAVAAAGKRRRRDRDPLLDDVATALVQLGWREAEADKAIEKLDVGDAASLEGLIRQALQVMPR